MGPEYKDVHIVFCHTALIQSKLLNEVSYFFLTSTLLSRSGKGAKQKQNVILILSKFSCRHSFHSRRLWRPS